MRMLLCECTAKVLTARMRLLSTLAAHTPTEIPVRLLSYINPFKPSAIFHPYQMDESVYHYRDVLYIYHHFNRHRCISQAKSEDPDETAHFAVSHLGLNCLHVYNLWDAMLKSVKYT